MFKKALKYLVITMFALPTYSQINLVPNPSFEDTVNCPIAGGQINYATSWNNNNGTPDYFNSCASSSGISVSVPYNYAGFRTAASGRAYSGIVTYTTYSFFSTIPYREYIGTTLTTSLTVGTKYYFSMKACLSFSPAYKINTASNNLGVKFSKSNMGTAFPDNNPKINFSSINADSVNWTKYFASFIADSAYKYVVIGNFFNDSLTQRLNLNSDSNKYAYYYIDNVCVSSDSLYVATYNWTGINSLTLENNVEIYPNPASDFVTLKNNSGTDINVEIYDALGKKVKAFNVNSYSQDKTDMSYLPKGLYLLIIKSQNNLLIRKIIKQ